jgi:hypothetical protein
MGACIAVGTLRYKLAPADYRGNDANQGMRRSKKKEKKKDINQLLRDESIVVGTF